MAEHIPDEVAEAVRKADFHESTGRSKIYTVRLFKN